VPYQSVQADDLRLCGVGDVPSISTIIGAVIIIGAGFYIFLREQQLDSRKRWSIRRRDLLACKRSALPSPLWEKCFAEREGG